MAVSPDEENVPETVSTLQFGANARQVALGQAKQNVRRAVPPPSGNNAWAMEDV